MSLLATRRGGLTREIMSARRKQNLSDGLKPNPRRGQHHIRIMHQASTSALATSAPFSSHALEPVLYKLLTDSNESHSLTRALVKSRSTLRLPED